MNQPAKSTIALLLGNPSPGQDRWPNPATREPLLITVAILDKAIHDPEFCQRLQGWKWPVVWSTDAMKWMHDHEMLDQ